MKIDNSQPLLTQQFRNDSNVRLDVKAREDSNSSGSSTSSTLASSREAPASLLSFAQSRELVTKANDLIKLTNSDIEFKLNEEAGRMVFYLKDATSGEVLRQIPDESMLRLSETIGQFLEQSSASSDDRKKSNLLAGLLADVKA
jgi:flagellar protein FlaG